MASRIKVKTKSGVPRNSNAIQAELLALEQMYNDMEIASNAMQVEIERLLPAKLKNEIQKVKARYGEVISQLSNQIILKEKNIKDETLRSGHTVRAKNITALYQQGKWTWDSKALLEYGSTKHYQILKFRKQGKPNVRIVRIP